MSATIAHGPRVSRVSSRRGATRDRLVPWMISPTILVLILITGFPLVEALRQSLYGAPGLDPDTGFFSETEPFVGLANFTDIFTAQGARFWNAMGNTTFLTVASVIPEVVVGVAMALIMSQALRGRGFVRAAILVPWAVPTAISGLLWKWIFSANGIANSLLGTTILWSADGFQAKVAVIIAEVWKTAPFIGLLTLAGLQIIPDEVYEAARVDGANAWKRFVYITLPLVRPALMVAILFRILDALRMFDLPYTLIGKRKDAVETMSMLAQDEAYNVRYGAAAAYAIILFVYVFVIAFVFVRLLGANIVDTGSGPTKKDRKAARRREARPASEENS